MGEDMNQAITFTDAELMNMVAYLSVTDEYNCDEPDCPTASGLRKLRAEHERRKAASEVA